jgi:hypothetical protein
LGTEVSSLADWERTLEWDLREIRNFNARYSGTSLKIWVVGYEAKIPELPVNDIPVRMSSYLDRFWESTGGNTDLSSEIGMGEGFENRLTPVIESVGRWMEEKSIARWDTRTEAFAWRATINPPRQKRLRRSAKPPLPASNSKRPRACIPR